MDLSLVNTSLQPVQITGDNSGALKDEIKRRYQTPKNELNGRTYEQLMGLVDKDKTTIAWEPFKVDTVEVGQYVYSNPTTDEAKRLVESLAEKRAIKDSKSRVQAELNRYSNYLNSNGSSDLSTRAYSRTADLLSSEFSSWSEYQKQLNAIVGEFSGESNWIVRKHLTNLTEAGGLNHERYERAAFDSLGKRAVQHARAENLMQVADAPPHGFIARVLDYHGHKIPGVLRKPMELLAAKPQGMHAQMTDLGINVARKIRFLV